MSRMRSPFKLNAIFKILGSLLLVESFFLVISLGIALLYGEGDSLAFLKTIAISLGLGLLLRLLTRKVVNPNVGKREGYFIVSFVWVMFSIIGALPFFLRGGIPSFTDAFFETMSGFTTTGSSILNDIESLPHGILFWRSLIQWMGGMGIIVMSLLILPALGIGGMQLFSAESPGPVADKLHPRVKETAKRLWLIYTILTVMEAILLVFGGMSVFDAVNHSFTTMATGGYSTKQASIGYWDSAYIQYVIIVFMFIAGMNFSLVYFGFKLQFKKIIQNEEFKAYMLITLIVTVSIAAILFLNEGTGFEQSIRDALFQVVTIMTTTGYATADYLTWHPFAWTLLFFMMFLGASAGSTAGGIKTMRVVVVVKNSIAEFKRLIHPNAVVPVRYNGKPLNITIVNNILAFVVIYILIFSVGTLVMLAAGLDFLTAVGSVATSLGNIGPGLGTTGPATNFYHLPDFAKWVLAFLMLVGRLELFTVLVLFSPIFWRK